MLGPELGRGGRPMLEPVRGLRVVAEPAALDGARWSGDGPVVLRSAPDEAFAIDATAVELADGHAIVVEERGWVGVRLDPDELAESVVARLEWVLPAARPALAQGSLVGIPAKVWLAADGGALVVVQAVYADELADRLGWRR